MQCVIIFCMMFAMLHLGFFSPVGSAGECDPGVGFPDDKQPNTGEQKRPNAIDRKTREEQERVQNEEQRR